MLKRYSQERIVMLNTSNVVKQILKFRDMDQIELADKCGVPKGTIDHYLAEKCTAPIAENAVKIAKALGVPVEYLVTGKSDLNIKSTNGEDIDERLCKKYYSLIKKLNSLPESTRNPICKMIEELN